MDITFREIPEELILTIKDLVEKWVTEYYRNNIKVPEIPKEEYEKAEANITAFKEANKERA